MAPFFYPPETVNETTTERVLRMTTRENQTPQAITFIKGSAFMHGNAKLGVYRNEQADRFEVYTVKGYKLSHSKTIENAMKGARAEIAKIQRRRAYRASQKEVAA